MATNTRRQREPVAAVGIRTVERSENGQSPQVSAASVSERWQALGAGPQRK